MSKKRFSGLRLILMVPVVVLLAGGLIIGGRALQEPGEVRTLKKQDRKSTRLNSSHPSSSRMPSSA